ncbi:sigma-54 interaction domain-containing protein [Peribacillus kribbensis]|uniref:sigma-54 interaction domain-containing protein n=1 Tax=Peribacillus kribbensis TaxID=356658 RepID=UPI00041670C5|nr:sigma 54-interacting transcriptional regulator [Peribacillus kribbensis]
MSVLKTSDLDPDNLDIIFNSMNYGVVIIDKRGKFVFINQAAQRKMNLTLNVWIGKHIESFVPNSVIYEALVTKSPKVNRISKIIGKDFLIDAAPIENRGKIIGAIATYRDEEDITALKICLNFPFQQNGHDLHNELLLDPSLPPAENDFFISQDSQLAADLKKVKKLSRSDLSILIRGESGVGKEVMAKSIHHWSNRKSKPFIAINCAAIPESLLESELFGYNEGAFTGAKRNGSKGKFELANGGTIFLDEIGDMSYHLQAKLLRVLQQKEIIRVGGSEVIPINVRVIAATNRDLEAMIISETFREDLLYRINGFTITIPPLNKRKKDIEVLIHHFLKEINWKYNKDIKLSQEAFDVLLNYSFPGNVRELRNVLEQAIFLTDTNVIEIMDLPKNLYKDIEDLPYTEPQQNNEEIVPSLSPLPSSLDFSQNITELEIKLMKEALKRSNHNRSDAIKMLGISRRSFYERLKKYKDEIEDLELQF